MSITRFAFTALLLATPALAGAQATNTDVYVAPITRIGDSIVIGKPVNATHRAGYDNQPAFTADSRSVLYVAQADGQTDIWRYDLAARRTRRLTATPESEYSPKPVPRQARFSVVRVERDSTQRLWSFANAGDAPKVEIAALKPVGYYAWVSPTTVVTYRLGSPSSMHLAEVDGSYDVAVATNVGRAVEAAPAGAKALFSFILPGYQGKPGIFIFTGRPDTTRYVHQVVMRDPSRSGALSDSKRTVVDSVVIGFQRPYELVGLAGDNEFHAWTPDGVLLSGSGSLLVRWSGQLAEGSRWIPVADLQSAGVRNISRLAVSPDGNWLAFVAEPAAK